MELIRLDFSNFQDYKEAKEILNKGNIWFWKHSKQCAILLDSDDYHLIRDEVISSEEWEELTPNEQEEHKMSYLFIELITCVQVL